MRPLALQQLGQRLDPDVPWQFLKRLTEQRPTRATELLNGLMLDTGKRRLIRCLDDQVRSVLSDRYRVLDNFDVAFTALDVARAHGGEVIEASLSEKHMRIKFTARDVWDKIASVRKDEGGRWYAGGLGNQEHLGRVAAKSWGDLPGGPGTVYPVVTISNSETGLGGFNVRIGLLLGVCFNLAIVESVAARVHLGEKLEAGIFSPETMQLDTRAIMAKAQDAIAAAFKDDVFKKLVAKANRANSQEIEAPQPAVDNVITRCGINQEHRDKLLEYFVRDYAPTAWGMAQAVSRLAQDVADPDDASELEDTAGQLIEKPQLVSVTA
jgi:hypothetical protein